jgi:hypothetical protein
MLNLIANITKFRQLQINVYGAGNLKDGNLKDGNFKATLISNKRLI